MAYTVTLYTDHLNSDTTKRPETTLATTSCVWKQGTALLSPTFLVGSNVGTIQDVTYVYIEEWDRYYKVIEIRFMRTNVYELDCEVDVLKSWSNTIKASSQYVVRSASVSDGSIQDNFYPITASETRRYLNYGQPFTSDLASGTFIVGITGTQALTGGVSYYGMTASQFGAMISAANSAVLTGATIRDWSNEAVKAIMDPFKYVQSVMWLPFETDFGTASVVYGPYGTLSGVTGGLVTETNKAVLTITFAVMKHPQAARGKYLNIEPFSEYMLHMPGFGSVRIPADRLQDISSIKVRIRVDKITGKGVMTITDIDDADTPIITVFGNVGVPIAFSALNALGEASGSISNAIGGLISGNIGQAISGAASIGSAMLSPTPTVSGGNGSLAQFNLNAVFVAIFHAVADEDNTRNGRPLCQVKTLSTLSGYCQTMNAHLHAGTAPESEEIERLMDGGFYLE